MKYLIGLLCLFSVAQAQFAPTSAKTKFVNGIGIGSKDTSQFTAADTIALTIARDSVMYYRYRGFWRPIATGGNLSAYKLISDTLFNNGYTTRARLKQGLDSLAATKGTVNSVGLTMPSAFNVANSPITTSGTLAVTAAGNATQYIRGDGVLANLPTSGEGGGASVSYYLNGSVNQGTIGGVTYYEMNKTPIIGAGTDFTRNSNGYIASFLTDANDPALLVIPAGNWNFETYFEASSGGGSPTFYIELYKYDGTTFTLIASNSTSPKLINDGTSIEAYFSALAVPQTTLTLTDRLAIRIFVTTAGRTITLHTENGHLCQVITTFTTGLTALNGLTAQVQYFATGTSGTDFNISSATATHTFNLPTASATNRGALSSADWTTFNNKIGAGDTAAMLLPYLRKTDTASMLSPYYRTVTANAALATKLNISDTAAMLSNYRRTSTKITNSDLVNSTISGVSLGNNLFSHSNGYGISGSAYNGSAAQTWLVDTANISTKANVTALLLGYAPSSGSTSYIQNGTSQQSSSNFNISGNGTIGGILSVSGATNLTGALDNSGAVRNRLTTRMDGNVGIGSVSNTSTQLQLSASITGSISSSAIAIGSIVQSGVTNIAQGFGSNIGTAAASFTLSDLYHFRVAQGTFGSGSTVTNQTGFFVENTMIGGTNNYAFRSRLNSGTNRWNLFMDGTAANHLQGNTLIGTTTDNGARLQVAGSGTFSGQLRVETASSPAINIVKNATVDNRYIRFTNSEALSKDWDILNRPNANGNELAFYNNTDAVFALRLTPTGAATFSSLAGTGTRMVVADANGLLSTQAIGSGAITGSGTTNYLPKFTGSTTVGNSQVFDNGTNVGIGTTNPLYKLDVNGTLGVLGEVTFSSQSEQLMTRITGLYSFPSGSGLELQYTSNVGYILAFNRSASTPLDISIGNTSLPLFLKGATGNVLVGTTTDNGARLQVAGSGTFTQGVNMATSSGNVGIGTTSPSYRTQISAPKNTTSLFVTTDNVGNAGDYSEIGFGNLGNGSSVFSAIRSAFDNPAGNANTSMQFFTNGVSYTERMRITSGGNLLLGTTTDNGARLQVAGSGTFTTGVNMATTSGNTGIGTTAPAYKLDVNGTLGVTGAATLNSSLTAGVFNQNTPVLFSTDNTNNSPALTIFKNTTANDQDIFRVQKFVNMVGVTTVASINSAGSATFSGTLGINGVADNVNGGTYTPTITNVANVTTSSLVSASFQRIGNTVTVFVKLNITPTASNTTSVVRISLPMGGNFTAANQANGLCVVGNASTGGGRINASTGGLATVECEIVVPSTNGLEINASFQYQVQ